MITIIDYGLGNLGSIRNMLRKIGQPSIIAATPETVAAATRVILPGVGSFDTGMRHLRESGMVDVLTAKALEERVPVLGICLGAQLMTRSSEEGTEAGLAWFAAETRRMVFDGIPGKWPLPNIGWRDVSAVSGFRMLEGLGQDARFYFVHSYYMVADDPGLVSMTTRYGFEYACGLHDQNLLSAQFHPEKSHKFGMQFLRNFVEQST